MFLTSFSSVGISVMSVPAQKARPVPVMMTPRMIDGDVEKNLNLSGVKVGCDHSIRSAGGDQIGDQLGRDRLSRFAFTVLTGVTEIRRHDVDSAGRRPFERIDHDKQLDQVVVGRGARRLYDKNIGASNALIDGKTDFAV